MAPTLAGLAANWQPDTLTQYLKDPEGYTPTDPRLAEQDKQYTMQMPAFEGNDADLASLVAWLLAGAPAQ
jgi:hypothetical protein